MTLSKGYLIRYILACVFTALVAYVANAANAEEHVIPVKNKDQEMSQAINKAQSSLPGFLNRYRNPKLGDRQFVLKVAIRDNKGIEHFWLTQIKLEGNEFVGTITNRPTLVRNVKYQQRYRFKRSDISDWGYFENGKAQGYHTLKVLLKRMPPQQANYYKGMMGW
jgi:uncharacterized protein YegJ (DUF2314 family)